MSTQDPPDLEAESHRRPLGRRLRRGLAVGTVVVTGSALAAAAVGAVRAAPRGGAAQVAPPPATATVTEGPLSSQINAAGTLTYSANSNGSEYSVNNQAGGIYTDLPSGGEVVDCGQVLYQVDNRPVLLLCGSTPGYRSLAGDQTGPDIRQLNTNLVQLGYADKARLDSRSDTFGPQTAAAIKRLQKKLGVAQTGVIALGDYVFLSGPIKVATVTVATGAGALPAEQVMTATSTQREVQVDLDAAQQQQLSVGDHAQVTLPGQTTTPATVARIGTVGESSGGADESSDASGSAPSPDQTTVPVYLKLTRPDDAGQLEHAPVRVEITTAGVEHALIVPVSALIGRSGGGYGVETIDEAGTRKIVPVKLGLFSDADGLVQVTGELSAGDRVVVPAT